MIIFKDTNDNLSLLWGLIVGIFIMLVAILLFKQTSCSCCSSDNKCSSDNSVPDKKSRRKRKKRNKRKKRSEEESCEK